MNTTTPLVDLTPRDEVTGEPLLSLTVCYVNLNKDCDFMKKQKEAEYMLAWQHPAPPHCNSYTEKRKVLPQGRMGWYKSNCNNQKIN